MFHCLLCSFGEIFLAQKWGCLKWWSVCVYLNDEVRTCTLHPIWLFCRWNLTGRTTCHGPIWTSTSSISRSPRRISTWHCWLTWHPYLSPVSHFRWQPSSGESFDHHHITLCCWSKRGVLVGLEFWWERILGWELRAVLGTFGSQWGLSLPADGCCCMGLTLSESYQVHFCLSVIFIHVCMCVCVCVCARVCTCLSLSANLVHSTLFFPDPLEMLSGTYNNCELDFYLMGLFSPQVKV